MASHFTRIFRRAASPIKFALFKKDIEKQIKNLSYDNKILATCLSPDKLDISKHICGSDLMIDLSRLAYERFNTGPERLQEWLRLVTRGAEGVRFLTLGRRDRAILGFDLDSIGFPVTRFEVCLLPNLFAGSRRPYIGYMKDNLAPYFDGDVETELEIALNNLKSGWWESDPTAREFLDEYRKSHIQKYISISRDTSKSNDAGQHDVVILGQCTGDQAIVYTQGKAKTNIELIESVLNDFSGTGRRLLYRAHPKNPKGQEEEAQILARFSRRVSVLDPTLPLLELIKSKPTIATMTSGAALEAAIRGCPIVTYAISFFSNWGFTNDAISCSRRRNSLTVEDVFLYVYTRYSTYMHPYHNGTISPLEALRGSLKKT